MRVAIAALALVLACGGDAKNDPAVEAPEAIADAPQSATGDLPRPEQSDGCEALRAQGRDDRSSAGLYFMLCPNAPVNARELRAALLLVDTPEATSVLLSRTLEDGEAEKSELRALARLATTAPTRFAPADEAFDLPPGDSAVVSPLSDNVLVQLAHASRRLTTGGLSNGQRLHARAIVARTYVDALRALGLDPNQALSPLARRLAGPALAHSLAFCRGYWRQGGRTLNARARELEMALLDIVRAVDRTAPHELDAQLTDAHHQAWRYLRMRDVRRRIASQLAKREKRALGFESPVALHGVEALAPFPRQLERLVIAGLPDLATEEALRAARDPDGFGIDPVESHLHELIGRHGFARADERARDSFDALRRQRRPPPALGPTPYESELPSLWTETAQLHQQARDWLDVARASSGLTREHALARVRLLLFGRPDLRAWLARDLSALPDELRPAVAPPKKVDRDAETRRALALPPT